MSDEFFEVKGGNAMRDLGRALKLAGNGAQLRKQLLRELREAGKPVSEAIRVSYAERMPHKGGLGEHLAKAKVSTRNKLSGKSAGVSIQTAIPGYDMKSIERGRLRHPTFGHRPWVNQNVEPGVIAEAIESQTPAMRERVLQAINNVVDEINGEAHV